MSTNGLNKRFLDLLLKQRNKFNHRKAWNGQDYYLTISVYGDAEKRKVHYFFSDVLGFRNLGWDNETKKDEAINMVDFGLTREGSVFVDWGLWHCLQSNSIRKKESMDVLGFLDFLRRDYALFETFLEIWKKGTKHPLEEGVLIYANSPEHLQQLVNFCHERDIPCDLNVLFQYKGHHYYYIRLNNNGITPDYGDSMRYDTKVFHIEELNKYLDAFENIE